ncbi:MAG TPA: HU family DNA-binding protein [bacterium]|nr:HU family DNA-binding protein [bacterium]
MNKEGLVDYVAAATGETRKQVSQVLDAILAGITDALRRDEKVTLVGFGTFQVRSRAAREGRNPRTGEKIQIPARKAPAFTAGKDLKAELGRS